MCLLSVAYQAHPQYPLILVANRDEFFDRPARPAQFWERHPSLLAGKDLSAGGTWLGVTRSGRIAALTNFRAPTQPRGVRSRGKIVTDYLLGAEPSISGSSNQALNYVESLADSSIIDGTETYSPYNFIALDFSGPEHAFAYFTNQSQPSADHTQTPSPALLASGVYALSNGFLDDNWPKITKARNNLTALINQGFCDHTQLAAVLADECPADLATLPETGISEAMEQRLSSLRIKTFNRDANAYGTRNNTVVTINAGGLLEFTETNYTVDGTIDNQQHFEMEIAR